MKKVIVFGVGNRLMIDDGIGIHVVEELSRRNQNPYIRYVVGETDIYYCLQQIEEDSNVIIIDAAYLGDKPGDISTIPFPEAFENSVQSIYAHESDFLNEIKLTGSNIKGLFIGIKPFDINYGMDLSSILKQQFSNIVDECKSVIGLFIEHINI